MESYEPIDVSEAFPAALDRRKQGKGWEYHPALQSLRSRRASGVYAIIARRGRVVLYVGESHSGRLYDTITRHFRAWKVDPGRDVQGRRRGGTTYRRENVLIAWTETPAGIAPDVQYVEIQRLSPRDNDIDGCGVVDAGGCPI